MAKAMKSNLSAKKPQDPDPQSVDKATASAAVGIMTRFELLMPRITTTASMLIVTKWERDHSDPN